MQLVPEVVQVMDPGDELTVYPVVELPPSLDGAVQDTRAELSPNTPATAVGAPGTVAGMTAVDADDVEPVPALFAAATTNV